MLLIRGATTSIGLAAAAIAKRRGARVLRSTGADMLFIDSGAVAADVHSRAGGADKVLELVAVTKPR